MEQTKEAQAKTSIICSKDNFPEYSEKFVIEFAKFLTGKEDERIHKKVLEVFKQDLQQRSVDNVLGTAEIKPGEKAGGWIKAIKETWNKLSPWEE